MRGSHTLGRLAQNSFSSFSTPHDLLVNNIRQLHGPYIHFAVTGAVVL